MIDIECMRKPKGVNPLDKVIHDFVILVMAKMLEKEFQPDYIFSNHPCLANGAWEMESDDRTPDVALGKTEEHQLIAIFEVETDFSLLNMDQIMSRLKLLSDGVHTELVLPESKLEQVKRELQQIPVRGFWTYTVDTRWELTVKKDPANESKILKATVASDDVTV